MNSEFKKGLIFNLSPSEIEAVCDDLVLFHKGYDFYYAVDAYDFGRYFIPYLQHIKLDKTSLNKIAQEKIAYETLFSDEELPRDNIILLDEYKSELFEIRDLFMTKLQTTNELLKNSNDLAESILKLFDSGEDPINVINKNFELFFLSLLFETQKGHNKISAFSTFFKKAIYINDFKNKGSAFDEIADNLFDQNYNVNLIDEVFDEFVVTSVSYISKFKLEDLDRYLKNTYHDIEALCRVYEANNNISKSEKHTKNIFYYLSSAPKSILLNKILTKKFPNISKVKSSQLSNFSVHRTIFQYFLFYSFSRNQNITLPNALDYLTFIKNALLNKNSRIQVSVNATQKEQFYIYDKLTSLNESLLSGIENTFYTPLVENYKLALRSLIDSTDDKLRSRMNSFKEFLKYQTSDLEYIRTKYERNTNILEVLNNQTNLDSKIKIRFPSKKVDVIQFHFHHLPYLPFIFESNADQVYHELYRAMTEISNIEDDNENNGKLILHFLKKLLSNKASEVREIPFEFLFLGYLDLLIINNDESIKYPNQEKNYIKALLEHLKIQGTLSHAKDYSITGNAVSNEIIYILMWLLRRNGYHKRVLEFESQILQAPFKDPRLYHGLALGYISDVNNKKDKFFATGILALAIDHLKSASEGYLLFLENASSQVIRELVIKNLIGVWNSICNTCNTIYCTNGNVDFLSTALLFMKNIHQYIPILNLNFDDFPTLNNTEGELLCNLAESAYYKMHNKELSGQFLEKAERKYLISTRKTTMMDKKFTVNLNNKLITLRREINK